MDTKKWKDIQIIFVYGFAIIFVGIMELLGIEQTMGDSSLKFSLEFDRLLRRAPLLLASYASIAAYTAATLAKAVSEFKEASDDYKDLEKKIANFAQNEYRPTIFKRFCLHVNKKRKMNAWKAKIYKQWTKLEKKETENDLAAWDEWQKEKKEKGNAHLPTENEYCLERARLERLTSEEYLEENVERLRVKYDAITSSVVLGGTKSSVDDITTDEYITKNKGLVVMADRAPTYMLSIALITMVTTILVDSFELEMHWTAWLLFVLKFSSKIFAMIWTIYNVKKYAETYNVKVTLKDIRFRWGMCCEHNQWVRQQQKELSKETEDDTNQTA